MTIAEHNKKSLENLFKVFNDAESKIYLAIAMDNKGNQTFVCIENDSEKLANHLRALADKIENDKQPYKAHFKV